MHTLRSLFTLDVFVSTAAVIADEQKDPADVGHWFDLTHFDNKDAFLKAAMPIMKELSGENQPTLYFGEKHAHFDVTSLITTSDISDRVWQLMEITESDYDLLAAYLHCFNQEEQLTVAEELEKAKGQLVGHYETNDEVIEDYLVMGCGLDDVVAGTLMKHLDKVALAKDIAADMKVHNNYYFLSES